MGGEASLTGQIETSFVIFIFTLAAYSNLYKNCALQIIYFHKSLIFNVIS